MLANGTIIGPYEIVGWLGSGGMGVVYRARDRRLGREVAIKLIPEAIAMDATRVRRFEQEARAAGQLNHPNILAVHDIGSHEGAPYIVSELLEGASLRTLLSGGALSPRKAIDYARQTAEGLAAAHDRAIVHRDVKPDNLFITADGRVKILDFGIAKLTAAADDAPTQAGSVTDTGPGMVVGTAAYMSPEQVRGEAVDTRSDLFSCGSVLHEMLTGRPAFARDTPAETMTAILKEEPLPSLPPAIPPALERIVSRCLEKARAARFQSARDLAFGLDVLTGTGAKPLTTVAPAADDRRWRRAPIVPWIAAGLLAIALISVLMLRRPDGNAASPALRLSAELGAGAPLAQLNTQFGDAATLSPDGSTIAFVAQRGDAGGAQLFVRRLNQLQAVALSGTEDALAPFFSPDGQWIGFFAGAKLRKIAVTGGLPVTLADAPSPRGGTWSDDGTVVFTPNQVPGTRLAHVSADGGEAQPLTPLAAGELAQMWPQMLAGGSAVLYTSTSGTGSLNEANLIVHALPAGAPKVVQRGGYHGRYVASFSGSPHPDGKTTGHLVYIHDGTLFAAPFDLNRLELTGQPAPALEGVAANALTGGAQFAVSANGTMMYLPGPVVGGGTPLDWMGPDGRTTPLRTTRANWFNLRFAPDGRRVAMEIRDVRSRIGIYEWARDSLTQLTDDAADHRWPVWTADGTRVAFSASRPGETILNLHWQRADGGGEAQRLTTSPNQQFPTSWHPTGRFLAFHEELPGPLNVDLMILPIEGDDATGWRPGPPRVFLDSPAVEGGAAFSPDGRWLAYSSNESGRAEIYVQPFPGPGGKVRVSTDGGNLAMWSRTRDELFFGNNGTIMVATFSVTGGSFRAEKPRAWSDGRYQARGHNRMFDLHPDGVRVALAPDARTPGRSRPDSVVFIFNFFEELRRISTPR